VGGLAHAPTDSPEEPKQWDDGRIAISVQDVADTTEDRLRVIDALRRAAEALDLQETVGAAWPTK
jgi:hypothetical protein